MNADVSTAQVRLRVVPAHAGWRADVGGAGGCDCSRPFKGAGAG